MAIEKEILDQLLARRDPQELFGTDGLLEELKKALSERILNTELDEHLGEERSQGNAKPLQCHLAEDGLTLPRRFASPPGWPLIA
jgi:putative transposase